MCIIALPIIIHTNHLITTVMNNVAFQNSLIAEVKPLGNTKASCVANSLLHLSSEETIKSQFKRVIFFLYGTLSHWNSKMFPKVSLLHSRRREINCLPDCFQNIHENCHRNTWVSRKILKTNYMKLNINDQWMLGLLVNVKWKGFSSR